MYRITPQVPQQHGVRLMRRVVQALTNSPGFSKRMELVSQQIMKDGVDAADNWWEASAVEPLAVYKDGFKGQHLQVPPPTMRLEFSGPF
jgi:hypothetical protein